MSNNFPQRGCIVQILRRQEMKKFLTLCIAMAMLFSACGKTEQAASSKYTAGEYQGISQGFGGDLEVKVTLSTDKIENVEVVSHSETEGVGSKAVEALPSKIVEANSTEVETVAGATVSSKAIIAAVNDAMKEFNTASVGEIKDGTYESEVSGFHGPLKTEVVIESGKIAAVNVLENVETVGIGTKALERLPQVIIDNQSVGVDVITGATVSSKALLAGVSDALEQAGADMAAFSVKPEVVKGEDQTFDADVVVVGAGGAGLTAAIEAKSAGAEHVILLDKMDITGGNTRMSGGEYGAPGNWVQLAEGIEGDTAEAYFEDIYKGGYEQGDKELIHILADNALEDAEWLRDFVGVEYKDTQSWYGGHRVARTLWPKGDGPVYVDTLQKKAEDLGVEIHMLTRAEELIQDEAGRVVGVKAVHKNGATMTYNAKNGVILTTGGFGANVELRDEVNDIWPTLDASVPTTNSPAITGDGIIMAQNAGANLVGMGAIQLYPVNNPATGNYYYIDYARLNSTALLVNKEGERFVNEKGTRDVISEATLNQTDSMVYELIDAGVVAEQKLHETYQAEIDHCQEQGVLAIGTIDEVCEHFGVPADTVKASIERYNSLVDAGEDTDFARTDNFNKIGEGPYFMFSSVVSVHHTMGGINIDTNARVLNTEGTVIPGLYAAGEVTGGIHGGNRLGSCAVADTVVFGRVAAQSCVNGL